MRVGRVETRVIPATIPIPSQYQESISMRALAHRLAEMEPTPKVIKMAPTAMYRIRPMEEEALMEPKAEVKKSIKRPKPTAASPIRIIRTPKSAKPEYLSLYPVGENFEVMKISRSTIFSISSRVGFT